MLNIVLFELKYYFKNKIEAIYIYSYFISILLLVRLTSALGSIDTSALAVMGLWVALASATFSGAQRLFARDHEQGLLEYYQLLPMPLELVMAGKWVAFYLFVMLPLLAILPLAGLFFQLSIEQLAHIAGGMAAGALALSLLASLVAALIAGIERAASIFALIGLPLSIPVLIFGSSYCQQAPGDSVSGLLLMLGFTVFMLPLTCWAGASAIRNSH